MADPDQTRDLLSFRKVPSTKNMVLKKKIYLSDYSPPKVCGVRTANDQPPSEEPWASAGFCVLKVSTSWPLQSYSPVYHMALRLNPITGLWCDSQASNISHTAHISNIAHTYCIHSTHHPSIHAVTVFVPDWYSSSILRQCKIPATVTLHVYSTHHICTPPTPTQTLKHRSVLVV